MVESGSHSGERGAYRLARPLPTVQVPATVQAVLAARIDRLAPDDTTAMAMYREMRMAFWLEKAEAAMGPPRRNSP